MILNSAQNVNTTKAISFQSRAPQVILSSFEKTFLENKKVYGEFGDLVTMHGGIGALSQRPFGSFKLVEDFADRAYSLISYERYDEVLNNLPQPIFSDVFDTLNVLELKHPRNSVEVKRLPLFNKVLNLEEQPSIFDKIYKKYSV